MRSIRKSGITALTAAIALSLGAVPVGVDGDRSLTGRGSLDARVGGCNDQQDAGPGDRDEQPGLCRLERQQRPEMRPSGLKHSPEIAQPAYSARMEVC